jgi:hypothetical protein
MLTEEYCMVCEETGDVLALDVSKEKLEIRAEKLGYPVITEHVNTIDEFTVLVQCGCGGDSYRCAQL